MRSALRDPVSYAVFVIPGLSLYALFFLYPMLTSVYYGFTDWDGLTEPSHIGLDNFIRALSDEDFRGAIVNNMMFVLFAVCIQVPLIVALAILISHVKRLQGFYKTAVFMPSILSTSVIGILWGFMYEPEIGLINQLLGLFGIEPIYWLADKQWALPAVLIANAWQWMGFYIVLVLAAVLAIPRELAEAAEIDGASAMQRAWYMTVPLIRPVISVIVMLSIAGAMRVVDIVLVMTRGGPVGATEVMASYMVNRAMRFGEYGYGTALAILIFVTSLLLTALYQITFGRMKERVEYG